MSNQEFPFECACGESFRMIHHARHCRKCRNYCVFGYCTHVTDLTTGQVVWGEEPTPEEYEAAAKQYETYAEMDRREMEMWEEADKERREAARAEWDAARQRERVEMAEDQLWDIQDRWLKKVG